ncbi:NAD-dependent epimerase/dehydratase family protein [Aquimarina pacifica]|uniref:NAD-dependent epimerase/dehydratase family protein n=1 Tax=Aquimarina pacifica TaxID=1296415 RepID=UPI00046F0445|nr:NAD-dependent epimerase/dehydratase family protein [Aquimarina pacifica]
MKNMVLVIGANGQLGSVLVKALRRTFGVKNVISSDVYCKNKSEDIFEVIDATDMTRIQDVVIKYKVTQIYHLAAILSAKGEENPLATWQVNMKTLFNVLEVARKNNLDKVFFPSSIAVFGQGAPAENTPNNVSLDPTTVYGISKVAGENWCNYYFNKYGLDVRSIRYPGIVGYQSLPGGGTTDYAVDIFHKAVLNKKFQCFLKKDTTLPMLFIDDAIRATLEIMSVPKTDISVRTSYNLSGISFSPEEVVHEIRKLYPDFEVTYQPDFRQEIAATWPKSIDDDKARKDWGWKPQYSLEEIAKIMIKKLRNYYHTDIRSLESLSV